MDNETVINIKGIAVRSGLEVTLVDGILQEAEIGFTTDTKKLFIGYKDEDGVLRKKEAFLSQEAVAKLEEGIQKIEDIQTVLEQSAGNAVNVQVSNEAPETAPVGGLWGVVE